MLRQAMCITCLCIVGCTFPDVTFAPVDATAGDAPDTAVTEAAIERDAADVGATGSDATSADATSGDVGASCDQDHDGHRAQGDPCGGDDCDDSDPNVHPGQDFVTFTPKSSNPLPGDFNCDGVVEKKLKHGVSCGLLTMNCAATYGFSDDPGCGVASDTYVTCADAIPGVSCKVGSTVTQTQACR